MHTFVIRDPSLNRLQVTSGEPLQEEDVEMTEDAKELLTKIGVESTLRQLSERLAYLGPMQASLDWQ